jgi:hypothetical protein
VLGSERGTEKSDDQHELLFKSADGVSNGAIEISIVTIEH